MITISKENYGTIDDKEITRYTLANTSGMAVKIIDYGGAITNIIVPDNKGNKEDVVLGFDTLKEYELPENPHFGSITGRFANRISKGTFEIDGKKFQVSVNNNGNTLHGGYSGFNRKIWRSEIVNENQLKFGYTSKDGEEGFPGDLSVEVSYRLTEENQLVIHYLATSDKATPINITNHSYFNLSAGKEETVAGHEIWIDALKYVPVNEEFIPTGRLEPVAGTVMDLTRPTRVGTHLDNVPGGGYDHTYVLNKRTGKDPELAGAVSHKDSGRYLEIYTTEPGVQFYTGNMLTGTLKGKKGITYARRSGLCLEAQHFPDSPNQPEFPDTILRPGETYKQTTIYKFSTR